MDGPTSKNGCETAWGDVTNAPLNPVLTRKAREVEMPNFEGLGVYERVPRSHQVARGGNIIGVRWVDVNKGDTTEPDYRSRLVGREFAVGRDDALYAATPPLKALGLIFSHAATIPDDGPKRTIMINDVRRAYFYGQIQRDVYIELPKEDDKRGTGMLGKFRLCFYGSKRLARNIERPSSERRLCSRTRSPVCLLRSRQWDKDVGPR